MILRKGGGGGGQTARRLAFLLLLLLPPARAPAGVPRPRWAPRAEVLGAAAARALFGPPNPNLDAVRRPDLASAPRLGGAARAIELLRIEALKRARRFLVRRWWGAAAGGPVGGVSAHSAARRPPTAPVAPLVQLQGRVRVRRPPRPSRGRCCWSWRTEASCASASTSCPSTRPSTSARFLAERTARVPGQGPRRGRARCAPRTRWRGARHRAGRAR